MGWNGSQIEQSYAIGAVSGNGSDVGGLVGWNSGNIVQSYWNKETSGQGGSPGGADLTTDQMMERASFDDEWDFDKTWGIIEGVSFPYLRWRLMSFT